MRVLIAILMALFLLSPAVSASADDPEITDPAGDHKLTGGAPDAGAVVKSVDLIKGWVEGVSETHLELRLQAAQTMRGGSSNGQSTTTYDYNFHFTVNGATYTATATVEGPAPPKVTAKGVAAEAFVDPRSDSTMIYLVALDAIGNPGPGDAITGMYAASKVYVSAATLGTDRAPDAGAGRDFVIPAPVQATAPVVYQNITAFPFLNETTEPVTGVFQYNWTGNGSAFRFLGEVLAGNLTLNATANGESIFAWNGTEGFDHTTSVRPTCVDEAVMPAPCQYAFVYTLTDFVGMVGIDFPVEHSMGETNATEEAHCPDSAVCEGHHGNETTDPAGLDGRADKESPAFALPLLILALVVIARRR